MSSHPSQASDLQSYLEFSSKAIRTLRPVADGMKYASYEEMLLANGRLFPQVRPEGLRLGEIGNCFQNALSYAAGHAMLYAEGYAIHTELVIPIQHGWAVNENGEAIDPTWGEQGWYFGITWDPDDALSQMAEVGYYGILGNDWLNKNKLLKEGP